MDNNFSDTNYSGESDANETYDEYLNDLTTGNLDFEPAKDDHQKTNTSETAETIPGNQEDMAEKVEGVKGVDYVNPDRRPNAGGGGKCVNDEHNTSKDYRTNPEDLVRDLESHLGKKKLSPQQRNVLLLTGSLNLGRGTGMTVKNLEKRGFGIDHAENLLRDLRKSGYLTALDKRAGHMKQYALPNCIHLVEAKVNGNKEEILPNDITLLIANRLSSMEDSYHNIHLETRLNYREDYELLGWPIPSALNRQKVQRFRLDTIRGVTFTISPNGMVNIAIECTLKPFKFHTAAGLFDFIATCGKISTLLQIETNNRMNVVSREGDWLLQHFDYNKDIPIKELEYRHSTTKAISWSSKGVLKLDYLGTIYQVYCKPMPFVGECLRMEGHYNAKTKVKLEDMVADIVNGEKHPFTTLEEMILNGRKNADDRNSDD